MDKWNKFLAKNPWFSYMLTGIMLTILWGAHFIIELDLTFTIIFSIIIIIVYPIMPLGAATKLLTNAGKKLDGQCDPYPLLLEVEDQLTYVKSADRRQLLMIERTTALSCMERCSEAYELLKAIDINMLMSTTLNEKAVYYANLSAFALDVGKFDESVSYHAKASQITSLLKNQKVKDVLFSSLRVTSAEQAIVGGDIQTAIALVGSVEDKTKRISVAKAFLYSKIALAKGDAEVARTNLLYVINNGNKLGCVEEAKALLETL